MEAQRVVVDELLKDHERTNESISRIAGCTDRHVIHLRHALEASGDIPCWRGSSSHPLTSDIVAALMDDHERYNSEVATELGCSQETIRRTRHNLERQGKIARWRGRPNIACDIRVELLKNHEMINKEIADLFCCTDAAVRCVRQQLERDGEIEVWRGSSGGDKIQHTYIIRGQLTGRFKVGKAKDVAKRVKDMQVGSPDTLEVVVVLEGARWEKVLHCRLKAHHSHGEWFEWNDGSAEIVSAVIKEAVMVNENSADHLDRDIGLRCVGSPVG